MKIFLTAALITAAFAAGAPAQTQAPPPAGDQATFKAAGEEVVLDVVVRDKKGRLVKDLKQSDFTVIDNGESRPVKSFRIVEGTDAISSSGARTQLDPLRQLRLITLVFQGGDLNAKKLSRDAAMELIKGELAQNVYISVMAIDHRLQAIQPFTNDRELIKKGITRATETVNDYTSDTISVRHDLEQLLGPAQGGDTSDAGRVNSLSASASSASGPGAATGNSGAAAAMARLMLTTLQNAQADETTDWSRGAVFPLLDLVKEQYLLPGRKTVLYFSGGFPIAQSTEDPFKQIISISNRSNVSFYAIDTRGLTTWSTNSSSVDGLKNAAGSSAANISTSTAGISTWQARSVDAAYDAGKSDTQNAIAMLSAETGGALIANTNDFRTPLRKVTEDIQSYYEITYDPQIQKYDGAFRKVMVKTDMADLKVQSRAGYFALPPNLVHSTGPVLASYEVPLLQALDQTPLAQNFNFQSAAMHFRTAGGSTCEVVVDIPVSGITLEENKTAGFFEGKLAYVAVVKDASGTVVKKLRQEVPMKVTPDKLEAYKAASHFIYNEGFNLPPGHYTLETAVIDMTSQKVSARKEAFDVPDNGSGLGMSSAIFVRNMKAKDPAAKPDDPMVTADGVLMPTVSPVVKKTEDPNLHFYVTIYPDKKSDEKPKMKMEFSKDGKLLAALDAPPPGAPDAQGRIQYPATIPDGGFPPGTYSVRFVAQQGAQKAAAEPVSFTIQ